MSPERNPDHGSAGNNSTGNLAGKSVKVVKPREAAQDSVAILQLEATLTETRKELDRYKEQVAELEARIWNNKTLTGDGSEEPRYSFGQDRNNSFNGLNTDELEQLDLGLGGLQTAIDTLVHKIQLKQTTMSVIQRQSITSRNRSPFVKKPRNKSINILGDVPLKSTEKLTAFDEHYGVLSDIRESKTQPDSKKTTKGLNRSGVSQTPQELESQVATLKAENEKQKLEIRGLKTALKRAQVDQTDLAMSVSKVLDGSQFSPTFASQTTKPLDKSVLVFNNTQASGLQALQEENEELIKKYTAAIIRVEDLESSFEALMKKFIAVARRESETQLANIQLQGELHRLARVVAHYSQLL